MTRLPLRSIGLVAVVVASSGCASVRAPRLDVSARTLSPRPAVLQLDSDPDGARAVVLAAPHDVVAECERTPCRITVPPGRYRLALDEGSILWMPEYEHELDLELGPCTAEHLTVQLRATGLARFRGYALSGIVLGLGVPVAFVGGAWTGVGLGMVGLSGLGFWASRHVSQHQGAVLTQARYPLGTEPGGPAAPPGCTAVSGAPQGESEVAPVSDPGDRRSL